MKPERALKQPTDPLPSRRQQQRQETRQRVFEAAIEVFRRDGVSASRIDDIALLAQVSRGTFYFHFPTKADVLMALLKDAESLFVDALVALPQATPIEDVLKTTAIAMAEQWSKDPQLWVEVGVLALRNTTAGLSTGDEPSGVRRALGKHFAQAAHRGELSAMVPSQVLADFFLANAFAVAVSWSSKPSMPLVDALCASAHLFLHGAKQSPDAA